MRIAAALLLGGAIVGTSANKTAIGISVLVLPVLMALSWLIGTGKLWRAAAIVSAIAITFAVPAGMYWLGIHKGLELPLSRSEMIEVALDALRADPKMLLHGAGWGSYNDILFRFLDHVRDVRVASETWQPSLDIMGGGAFHTHNSYLEATISTGLPGGILMMVLPLTAILCARRRSHALLCSVWVVVAGLLRGVVHTAGSGSLPGGGIGRHGGRDAQIADPAGRVTGAARPLHAFSLHRNHGACRSGADDRLGHDRATGPQALSTSWRT